MRQVIEPQMQLGETDIGAVDIDPKSRDDIPQLLRGLQHLYITPTIRDAVFELLEEVVPTRQGNNSSNPSEATLEKVATDTGRPGMSQWNILVLGTLRLGLNADYDRIQELANQHTTLRQILGHSDWADNTYYELQTLKDNVRLFTPELLGRINQIVVQAGHQALKKSPDDAIVGRCDSFVVETHVHFPTDINLLLDAIRQVINISAGLADVHAIKGWRQQLHHQRQFKKQYRKVQRLKHSTSKDETKKQQKKAEIEEAHRDYIALAHTHLDRAEQLRAQLNLGDINTTAPRLPLDTFMAHAKRQIDQIERRVLKGEVIPHEEKVFSLYQPHTEWISKGKAGVPVELGLRVCVVEDRDRFILHHLVMEKQTDEKVAVEMVDETKKRYPTLRAISMDKGFHSRANQEALKERLDCVVLPKKGRLSQADKERESSEEFVALRRQHSAVESAINALEIHGLDTCPDHGIAGFNRYVALAVVARNIQRLGAVLRQQEVEAEQRKRGPYRKRAA